MKGVARRVGFRFLGFANWQTAYGATLGDIMAVTMIDRPILISYVLTINGIATIPTCRCGTLFIKTKTTPFALEHEPA